MLKTYSELIRKNTYEDRINYLMLRGMPAVETFGSLRHINQSFYKSNEWKNVRDFVISRDNGWDLGLEGRDIFGKVFVHHMNPVDVDTLVHSIELAIDPEYLITVSHDTHQIIHFGQKELVVPKDRYPGDTKLW